MLIRVAGQTDIGRVRRANEDAFIIRDFSTGNDADDQPDQIFPVGRKGALMAVVDGGGGHIIGPIAAATTLETLETQLSIESSSLDVPISVENAVKIANKKLKAIGHDPEFGGINAQLVALFIYGTQACIASIGESRVHLLRDNQISQITKDHSHAKAIDNKTAEPLLGVQSNINIGLRIVDLRSGDIFILCSDGIHSHKITELEIVDAINNTPSYAMAGRQLVDLANQRGGWDNVTVVIGRVDGDELRPAHSWESVESTVAVLKEFEYVYRPIYSISNLVSRRR